MNIIKLNVKQIAYDQYVPKYCIKVYKLHKTFYSIYIAGTLDRKKHFIQNNKIKSFYSYTIYFILRQFSYINMCYKHLVHYKHFMHKMVLYSIIKILTLRVHFKLLVCYFKILSFCLFSLLQWNYKMHIMSYKCKICFVYCAMRK